MSILKNNKLIKKINIWYSILISLVKKFYNIININKIKEDE